MIYLLIGGVSESETNSFSLRLAPQQEVNDVVGSETDVPRPPLSSHSQETNSRTPRKAIRFFAKDTPRKSGMQLHKKYRSSYAGNQRTKLLEFLGWECYSATIEYFFDHVLPPLRPDLKVDDIFYQCVKSGLLAYAKQSNNYRWKKLTKNISDKGLHETKTYNEPLKNIFDEIAKMVEDKSTTSLIRKAYFHADGNRRTWSEKNIGIKPDAHIFMMTPDNGYSEGGKHWYNAACSFQFKKAKEKRAIYEVLYSLLYITLS